MTKKIQREIKSFLKVDNGFVGWSPVVQTDVGQCFISLEILVWLSWQRSYSHAVHMGVDLSENFAAFVCTKKAVERHGYLCLICLFLDLYIFFGDSLHVWISLSFRNSTWDILHISQGWYLSLDVYFQSCCTFTVLYLWHLYISHKIIFYIWVVSLLSWFLLCLVARVDYNVNWTGWKSGDS